MAIQVQRTIQSGLPTHGGKYRIRSLRLYDLCHGFPLDRFDIGRIGKIRIRHDGGRIRVHQYDPVSLLPERLAGLNP